MALSQPGRIDDSDADEARRQEEGERQRRHEGTNHVDAKAKPSDDVHERREHRHDTHGEVDALHGTDSGDERRDDDLRCVKGDADRDQTRGPTGGPFGAPEKKRDEKHTSEQIHARGDQKEHLCQRERHVDSIVLRGGAVR